MSTKKLPKNRDDDSQGQRLRRLLQGYKKRKICEVIGYEETGLSRVINDRAGISDEKLLKIAEFLGIPFDEIRVTKITDKSLLALTIDHVVISDKLLDSFFRAPLDKRTRQWLKGHLRVMKEYVDSNRAVMIELEARKQRRVAKLIEEEHLRNEKEQLDKDNPV